jgi:trigger factor
MAINVETLDKLERKIILSLPAESIHSEVDNRLKRIARTIKVDGFRPGKVPMNVVAQRYGHSVQYEVLNDKVGQAFAQAANEAQLRVAGQPRISEVEDAPVGQMMFNAVFEVYPEVKVGDLSAVQVEKLHSEVDDAAIQKTLEVLRKQRRSFAQRAMDATAAESDRATVDFEGKVDGEPFEGGKSQNFQFVVGEGQMLQAFEQAVVGMKVGESRSFQLPFPDDYKNKEVAGKSADFIVTLNQLESSHLPEVNEAFVKSLRIPVGTLDALMADIKKSLNRELKARLLAKNKQAAIDALVSVATLDLPQSIVQSEMDRLVKKTREDLKQRGIPDADKAPIPPEIFRPQAENRVRMGLVVGDLVRTRNLAATPEQIKAYVEDLAASYEKPDDVVRWYYNDKTRMAEVEAIVVESNVTSHVLAQAQVLEKTVSFTELIGQS